MSNEQLKNHVLSIVKTLEEGFKYDGDSYFDDQYEIGDIISAYDYLEDVLDIQYIVNGEGEYLGARVLVAFGGPNIWIDTNRKLVEGYWWGDSFIAEYHGDVMGVDDALSELWGCR